MDRVVSPTGCYSVNQQRVVGGFHANGTKIEFYTAQEIPQSASRHQADPESMLQKADPQRISAALAARVARHKNGRRRSYQQSNV